MCAVNIFVMSLLHFVHRCRMVIQSVSQCCVNIKYVDNEIESTRVSSTKLYVITKGGIFLTKHLIKPWLC